MSEEGYRVKRARGGAAIAARKRTMPSSAFVSVILPVYNAAPFVAATMASLLDQSHRELEIIAVDDGSTDNSHEVLKNLASKDSRIRVFTKQNGGSSAASNFGLAHATGDFIARM